MAKNKSKNSRFRILHIVLRVLAGVLLIAGGIILSLPGVPGPGFILLALGIILVAEESRLGQWLLSKSPKKIRDRFKKPQNESDQASTE